MHRALLTLAAAAWLAVPAAADLARIDRSIQKEPAYKNKPQYLLLAFGPKAADRVWLVRDGDVLYVDRNGDGDLTGKDERIARKVEKNRSADDGEAYEVGELRVGGKVHKGLMVGVAPLKRYTDNSNFREFKALHDTVKADANARGVMITLDVESATLKGGGIGGRLSMITSYDNDGFLQFAASAKDASVVHFDGPMHITYFGWRPTLKLGRANDLILVVGTPGKGAGSLAMLVYEEAIPAKAHPTVEVQWPAARKGDKPIKQLYELKERC